MKRLQNHLIGVEQGETLLFSDFQNNGPMWADEGERCVIRQVRFSEPYRKAPNVQVALSMWDIHSDRNSRIEIAAEAITAEGFELVFRTWGDTQVARARANWLAIGELPHEDDWDIP
ncbi:H-type lectin domain-containing protein [Aliiruegeria lutimaris]|uniref:H-type lectin domain-containing protein n=1 Tax=Aliiruegeria lutimaris TaxID=571298 RepID=A0A1G9C641_9RHOB|nr:H-type lectin domain-containing protein [Aliiruegeria lutimaris]SDK47147.1 H-type lectin domain-containing protein [Aliiruegeria lutimaris]